MHLFRGLHSKIPIISAPKNANLFRHEKFLPASNTTRTWWCIQAEEQKQKRMNWSFQLIGLIFPTIFLKMKLFPFNIKNLWQKHIHQDII